MSQLGNQVVKNILSHYATKSIGLFLGFLLIPFLVGKLGKEAFGLIALAESTIFFFEILTISVRISLSRHTTYALAKGEAAEFVEYLSTGRAILFASAILILLFGTILSIYFPFIFKVPHDLAHETQILFFIISFTFAITAPNMAFWSVLYARQRFDWINMASSLALVLRAVAIFTVYSLVPPAWANLVTYGVIYFLVTWIDNLTVYFLHRPLMPSGWTIKLTYFRWGKVKEIISYSAHTSLTRMSNLLYDETAHILINVFWGPLYNAVYSVGLKMTQVVERLFLEPSWVLAPTFTVLAARNEKDKLKAFLFIYTKMMAILVTPLCFVIIFLAKPIVLLWVGEGFNEAARIIPVLIAPLLFTVPFSVCGCVNGAYGKVKIPSRLTFAAAVFNVILGILLGRVLGWRLLGFAVASSLAVFVNFAFFHSFYACHVAKISIRDYWFECLLRPLASCGLMVGSGLWFIHRAGFTDALNLVSVALIAAVAALSYFVAYRWALRAEERQQLQEVLRSFLINLKQGSGASSGEASKIL